MDFRQNTKIYQPQIQNPKYFPQIPNPKLFYPPNPKSLTTKIPNTITPPPPPPH